MSAGDQNTMRFRNTMFGYNKSDVDGYVERTESELEIQKNRYSKQEQQVNELRKEAERGRNIIQDKETETHRLLEQNAQLRRTIADLENRLEEKEREFGRMQEENSRNESDLDTKTIQDAILNAQRMGEIILNEARQESDSILQRAQATRQEQEEEGKRILEQADQDAKIRVQTAQDEYDRLRRDYKRVLMDVTDFRNNLLWMYREHMETLLTLPDRIPLEMKYTDEVEITEENKGKEEAEKTLSGRMTD